MKIDQIVRLYAEYQSNNKILTSHTRKIAIAILVASKEIEALKAGGRNQQKSVNEDNQEAVEWVKTYVATYKSVIAQADKDLISIFNQLKAKSVNEVKLAELPKRGHSSGQRMKLIQQDIVWLINHGALIRDNYQSGLATEAKPAIENYITDHIEEYNAQNLAVLPVDDGDSLDKSSSEIKKTDDESSSEETPEMEGAPLNEASALQQQPALVLQADVKAEDEANRKKAEDELRAKAEDEANRKKAEDELRAKAEDEANRKKAEDELRAKAEDEANRKKAEDELRAKAEDEANRKKAEDEARAKIEDEANRKKAEDEARAKIEDEANRKKAEDEARAKIEDEANRKKAEDEARAKIEDEANRKKAEDEVRAKAEDEVNRKKAEDEVRAKAEDEANRKKAEEEARKAEEATDRAEAEEDAALQKVKEAHEAELAVVNNPITSPEDLLAIAQSTKAVETLDVICSRNFGTDTFNDADAINNEQIELALLENPEALGIISFIAHHTKHTVTLTKIQQEVLDCPSDDKDGNDFRMQVLSEVVNNEHCSKGLKLGLIAAFRSRTKDPILKDVMIAIIKRDLNILSNKGTPDLSGHLLRDIIRSHIRDTEIDLLVAQHPEVSVDDLKVIAKRAKDANVLVQVVLHDNADQNTLLAVMREGMVNVDVLYAFATKNRDNDMAIINHLKVDFQVLAHIANETKDPVVLATLADHPIARDPGTPGILQAVDRKKAAEEAKAEDEARRKADEEARAKAAEAAPKVDVVEVRKAEADAQAKPEADAQAKAKAEADAQAKAEAEAHAKAEAEAHAKAEAEAHAKAEAEAHAKAEAEAHAEAEERARRKAEEAARLQAEEAARLQAEEAARLQAEEAARLQAEEAARLQAEEAARQLAAIAQQPVLAAQQPAPAVQQPQPAPAVQQPQPAPAVQQPQPAPVEQQPKPVTFVYKPVHQRPSVEQVKAVIEKPAAFNELNAEQKKVVFTKLPSQVQTNTLFTNALSRFGRK